MAGSRCLDVGCGTGCLTVAAGPQSGVATGVDASEGFVGVAAAQVPEATFQVGDAAALPFGDDSFDAVVSGLVLNFVPDHAAMVAEMRRSPPRAAPSRSTSGTTPRACSSCAASGTSAAELDPEPPTRPRASRCARRSRLPGLFETAGLADVAGRAIVVPRRSPTSTTSGRRSSAGRAPAPAYFAASPGRSAGDVRDRLHDGSWATATDRADRAGLGGPRSGIDLCWIDPMTARVDP